MVRDYDVILALIKRAESVGSNIPFATKGDTILAKTAVAATILADFLDCLGYCSATGYYDPEEDERSNEMDDMTGLWYVDVC